jgi:hypothetical protein
MFKFADLAYKTYDLLVREFGDEGWRCGLSLFFQLIMALPGPLKYKNQQRANQIRDAFCLVKRVSALPFHPPVRVISGMPRA